MSRKLIVCLDGTGNEIEERESNILRLYKCLKNSDDQLIHYETGVGTSATRPLEKEWFQSAKIVRGLIFGSGLAAKIVHAYSFLSENFKEGDKIYLFGYSRGAYTARALAGFIHDFGLVAPHEIHLIGPAVERWLELRNGSERHEFKHIRIHQQFFHIRKTPIQFLGLWDTVGSVLRPQLEWGRFIDHVLHHNIDKNASVRQVAHAVSIDERRRFFRPLLWQADQDFQDPRHEPGNKPVKQILDEVWFPGTHTDNAGSVARRDAGLSKITLVWMHGVLNKLPDADKLVFDKPLYDRFVLGEPDEVTKEQKLTFAKPDPHGKMHDQLELQPAWKILEYLPRLKSRRKETEDETGYYLPRAEPRVIPKDAIIHSSAFIRRSEPANNYKPSNLVGFNPPSPTAAKSAQNASIPASSPKTVETKGTAKPTAGATSDDMETNDKIDA